MDRKQPISGTLGNRLPPVLFLDPGDALLGDGSGVPKRFSDLFHQPAGVWIFGSPSVYRPRVCALIQIVVIRTGVHPCDFGFSGLRIVFAVGGDGGAVPDRMQVSEAKALEPDTSALPSLGSLQHFSNRMVMIGVPLLILALVLGGIWANKQIGSGFWYDPKIFGSILVILSIRFICTSGQSVDGTDNVSLGGISSLLSPW